MTITFISDYKCFFGGAVRPIFFTAYLKVVSILTRFSAELELASSLLVLYEIRTFLVN
jgi:hypothetical protein